jgi:small subunit ribosomal protein S17
MAEKKKQQKGKKAPLGVPQKTGGKKIVGTSNRGRTFSGYVIKKFEKRVVVEFERTVSVPKYERFTKKKTKLHARFPEDMHVEIGDYIKIRETRPLSKITHFIVIEVLKKKDSKEEGK